MDRRAKVFTFHSKSQQVFKGLHTKERLSEFSLKVNHSFVFSPCCLAGMLHVIQKFILKPQRSISAVELFFIMVILLLYKRLFYSSIFSPIQMITEASMFCVEKGKPV